MPFTVDGKIDFNLTAKIELEGNEVSVELEEMNISVDKITVH